MEGEYIGPQVKAARKLRGIKNTKVLAGKINRSGFGEKVIGQIERDQRAVREWELPWLAEALGMTVDELRREPQPPSDTDIDARLRALDAKLDRILERLDGLDQIRTETGALLPGIAELLRPTDQEDPVEERARS